MTDSSYKGILKWTTKYDNISKELLQKVPFVAAKYWWKLQARISTIKLALIFSQCFCSAPVFNPSFCPMSILHQISLSADQNKAIKAEALVEIQEVTECCISAW